ncbi:MAG: formylglycine-generating enzyme family protein [Polyangiales bacterium]
MDTPAPDTGPAVDVPPIVDVPPTVDVPPAVDVPPTVDVPPAVDVPPIPSPSCPDPTERGCGVVAVSGGAFVMGSTDGAARATPLQSHITVSDFAMDAHLVTVARFRRFWNAGHPAPTGAIAYPRGRLSEALTVTAPTGTPMYGGTCNWTTTAGGRELHPINCVNRATAQSFCVWDGGRLPTEAEWEYAARGRVVEGLSPPRSFPWGDQLPSAAPCDRAQFNACAGEDGANTRRVGSFAASGGLYDMAGQVWQWMADRYVPYSDPTCWGDAVRVDPLCEPTTGSTFTLRGGFWGNPRDTLANNITSLRSATRGFDPPSVAYEGAGFRCVRSATACTSLPASTRCGRELLADWSLRPYTSASCDAAWEPQSFSSASATTSLSTCTEATRLVADGSAAEVTFAPLAARCASPAPFTLTLVGSLPTNLQRFLALTLRWATGESISVDRWVWNSAVESSVDVRVSTTPGTFIPYASSSADTGGARADRPWGSRVGNDASGWWRVVLTVDPAADRVTVTFEQPSRSATVYTATYSAPIPDTALPTLTLDTRANCEGSVRNTVDSRILSLTASPSLWW